MKNTKDKEVFRKAVEFYGEEAQLDMVVEECAELIKAICKYKRNQSMENIHDVIEEVADVQIMLDQIPYIIEATGIKRTQEDINAMVILKKNRLRKIINKEEIK